MVVSSVVSTTSTKYSVILSMAPARVIMLGEVMLGEQRVGKGERTQDCSNLTILVIHPQMSQPQLGLQLRTALNEEKNGGGAGYCQ